MAVVHVWYRGDGEIIGVGRAVASAGREMHAVPVVGDGQDVLEAEVDEAAVERLHETHRVDHAERRLVAKG